MIVVTGGAGFIGSAIVFQLNKLGEDKIIIVDDLALDDKWKNLAGLKFIDIIHKDEFIKRVVEENLPFIVEAVIHMGACSSTTEKDANFLLENNFKYTLELVKYCIPRKARFIYASSAATYGGGAQGYNDDESKLDSLRPMNMYGYSKHLFDQWAVRMELMDKIVGLKYFNVFGPNEYHKGDMRSVIHKAYEQIRDTGKVKLFKSYKNEFADGDQKRDFIYVKDAVDMTLYFLEHHDKNGLFNVGTGNARTWNELVKSIFNVMGKPIDIEYIEMPENIKNKYQYYTKAEMSKLKNAGYDKQTHSLEDGIIDYVKNYLIPGKYLAD